MVGGVVTYFWLPSQPSEAKFLTREEKNWITEELEREDRRKQEAQEISAIQALFNPRVLYLACIGFGHGFGTYTFSFWMPQLLKSVLSGSSNSAIGWFIAIPNFVGLVAMVLTSRHSDRTLERRYHLGIPISLAGVALLLLGTTRSPAGTVALLSCVALGTGRAMEDPIYRGVLMTA